MTEGIEINAEDIDFELAEQQDDDYGDWEPLPAGEYVGIIDTAQVNKSQNTQKQQVKLKIIFEAKHHIFDYTQLEINKNSHNLLLKKFAMFFKTALGEAMFKQIQDEKGNFGDYLDSACQEIIGKEVKAELKIDSYVNSEGVTIKNNKVKGMWYPTSQTQTPTTSTEPISEPSEGANDETEEPF